MCRIKDSGFTLVEIMIVVSIIALLAAIAIPNLLRAKMTANESAAQATLRTISTAFETYAAANAGQYPLSENDLRNTTPPYLNQRYSGQVVRGYSYNYSSMATAGYIIIAAPEVVGVSGNRTYTVTTGSILTP